MACSCKGNKKSIYRWTGNVTDEEGEVTVQSIDYPSEIQAKAKVMRGGGAYKPVPAQ